MRMTPENSKDFLTPPDKEMDEEEGKSLMGRAKQIASMPVPFAKEAKDKLHEYLNTYINEPAAKSGHEDLGAAISSALDAAGELVIPSDMADVALSALGPLGKAKIAAKATKDGLKLIKAEAKPGVLNYETQGIKSFSNEALQDLKKKAAESEANAYTIQHRGKKIQELKPPTKKVADDEYIEILPDEMLFDNGKRIK